MLVATSAIRDFCLMAETQAICPNIWRRCTIFRQRNALFGTAYLLAVVAQATSNVTRYVMLLAA